MREKKEKEKEDVLSALRVSSRVGVDRVVSGAEYNGSSSRVATWRGNMTYDDERRRV